MTNILLDIGICCFCGDDCNACSQCCGLCSRSLTGNAMGWDISIFPKQEPMQIYYSGIGADLDMEFMTEIYFRQIMLFNADNFNEICPYDIQNCKLELLVNWSGGSIIL